MGDLTMMIPAGEADICILEEPEHLNWYRAPGKSWRRTFTHVVGIVHTNYLAYSAGYSVWAPVLTFMLRCVHSRVYSLRVMGGGVQPGLEQKEGFGRKLWLCVLWISVGIEEISCVCL